MPQPAPVQVTVTDDEILSLLNQDRQWRLVELMDALGYSPDSRRHVVSRLQRLGWTVRAGRVQRKPGPKPGSKPLAAGTAEEIARSVQTSVERGASMEEALEEIRREVASRVDRSDLEGAIRQVVEAMESRDQRLLAEITRAMEERRRTLTPPRDEPEDEEPRPRRRREAALDVGQWAIAALSVLFAVGLGAMLVRPGAPSVAPMPSPAPAPTGSRLPRI